MAGVGSVTAGVACATGFVCAAFAATFDLAGASGAAGLETAFIVWGFFAAGFLAAGFLAGVVAGISPLTSGAHARAMVCIACRVIVGASIADCAKLAAIFICSVMA